MTHPRSDDALARIVDRSSDLAEAWQTLDRRAASDPSLYEQLIDGLRDRDLLASAVGAAVARSERVDLPGAPLRPRSALRFGARFLSSRHLVAAAVLLLAAVGVHALLTPELEPSAPPIPHDEELLVRYLDDGVRTGRVVETLPHVLVGQRPVPNGEGLEIVYLRRIVERTVVPAAFHVVEDELGRVIPGSTRVVDAFPTSSL